MLVQAESKVPQELLGRLEPQELRVLRGLKDLKASPVQLAPQVRPAQPEQLDKQASLELRGPRARPVLLVLWERLVQPVSQVHKAQVVCKGPQEPPDKLALQGRLV